MKEFILSVFKFILFVGLYLLTNMGVNTYLNTNSLKVNNCKIIVIGDSHLMTGVNPNFADGLKNYAQSSEPYLASYLKLQKLLSGNSEISRVLLGFGYHNLSAYYDEKLLTNESSAIFNNNIQLLSANAFKGLDYDKERYLNSYLKKQCIYPQWGKKLYLGEFKITKSQKLKGDLNQTIFKHFYKDKSLLKFSDSFNLYYLEKIVNLCSEYNVKLTLVRTPTSSEYSRKVPRLYRDKYLEVCKAYIAQGVGVFHARENDDIFYYKDYTHLSTEGADIFTPLLINQINSIE
ncbi:hypothetical protein OAD66_07900 [Bacteroidia bacterium]|nr:hypothetical protein [Bacteroidia bacterium]